MAEIGLKSIPDIVIDSFKKLEFFDFRSNRMLNIPQNAFYNMRQLRHLDFRYVVLVVCASVRLSVVTVDC